MSDLISIIVPCFNEEKSLRLFHEAVKKTEESMPDCRFELLLVNDGSKDKTLEVMRELAAEDSTVKYFSFSRNFGKEAAMYAGFCHVQGDYAAVMDADLQDPPDLLPEMYRLIKSGEYDSVAARRVNREGRSQGFPADEKGDGGCNPCHERDKALFQRYIRMDRFQDLLDAL